MLASLHNHLRHYITVKVESEILFSGSNVSKLLHLPFKCRTTTFVCMCSKMVYAILAGMANRQGSRQKHQVQLFM